MVTWLYAAAAAAIPTIQHWQTGNGARVYFVPAPELPMVDISITFAAGSARDDGKYGLAELTNVLLDKGAAGLSADEIARRAEDLGAELGSGSARDMAWVSLRSLSDTAHLQPALELLRDIMARPDFNRRDFERERKRQQIAIRQSEQSPGTVASYRFYLATYGQHPYAMRPAGTVESLGELQLEDIRAYHARYYVARNAVLSITGDLDRKAAERLAEYLMSAVPAGERAAPLPPPAPLQEAEELRIFHPSTQTHVRMGQPGMHRGDPDYFPLYVGNHILGGAGLVSQLHQEVRENRGLSYGVRSYFIPMAQDGPFLISLQTRNDQVDEALGVARATLEKFVEEGPTEEELAAAKKNITGGFPLRIDSNSKIGDYLTMIGFHELPLDYLETFSDKVEAVTREQIMDAFRRRVLPERMVTVIVGGDS
jgi:zinc protease